MSVVEQVRQAIRQYAMLVPGDRLVVGVSGGADSLTLLHVLHLLAPELTVHLHVAHLDHRIRGPDSAADADFVTETARAWGIPVTVEARDVPAYAATHGLAIEEAARQVRYAFLAKVAAEVGAQKVTVAHTADDQVETVLMHFLRGSGLAGLRGMLPVSPYPMTIDPIPNPHLVLLRPLLETTRAEIESYVQAHGFQPRFDLSNLDRTLYRNRLRSELIPQLETYNPRIRDVVRRTARIFSDDFDYVHQQVLAAWAEVVTETADALIFALAPWKRLHPSLQRGLLREAIRRLRRELRNINWIHIEGALSVANEKPAGSVATLPQGLALFKSYATFTLAAAPLRPVDLPRLAVDRLRLAIPGVTPLPGTDWQVIAAVQAGPARTPGPSPQLGRGAQPSEIVTIPPLSQPWERGLGDEGLTLSAPESEIRGEQRGGLFWHTELDFDRTGPELFLRRRQPGDRFQPLGMSGHSVLLREFMINVKIPAPARHDYPLVVSPEHIVWLPGYRIDERVKVTGATRHVLSLRMQSNS